MGRRTETDITIKTYLDKMEDRYLIGYLMQGQKKVPITFGLNVRKGYVYLKPAWEAIEDQRAIYELENSDKKVSCVNRVLLEKPHVFYGFSKPPVELNRKEEAEMRKKVKKLGETLTEREIDRELYGDEIFYMVGKFKTTRGVEWLVLGKIKKANGEEITIRQILARDTAEAKLEMRYLGMDGACYNSFKNIGNNIYTWNATKQSLGVPKLEFIRKGKEGIKTTYLRFDPTRMTKFEKYDPNEKEETKLFDYVAPDMDDDYLEKNYE